MPGNGLVASSTTGECGAVWRCPYARAKRLMRTGALLWSVAAWCRFGLVGAWRGMAPCSRKSEDGATSDQTKAPPRRSTPNLLNGCEERESLLGADDDAAGFLDGDGECSR